MESSFISERGKMEGRQSGGGGGGFVGRTGAHFQPFSEKELVWKLPISVFPDCI